MAVIPKITYNVVFQPNVVNKLSNTAPYDTCTVNFSSNVHIKKFYARATYEDEAWDYNIGTLIAEFTNRDGNTQLSFDINANQHLLEGEGTYRIGLYLQNDQDVWNLEELFLTTETGNTHLTLKTSDNEDVYVGRGVPLTQIQFTCNAGTIIDLNTLNGLDSSRIVWGDGTTTHSGTQHTYSSAGTYTIQANFQNVNLIGNYFLYQNTAITSIDLSQLSNVTNIGSNFMNGCTALTSITISGFSNVVNVGANFLYGCSSLTSVNISVFSNLTKVPDGFLNNCSSITTISFNSWSNLTELPNNFMAGMSSVVTLDLSGNTTITTIGNNFLRNCTSLTTLYVPLTYPPTLGGWGITTITSIVCGAWLLMYNHEDVWKELASAMKQSI